MAVNPTSSFGAVLSLGDGASPEVFAAIAGVTDISGPNLGVDTAETTAHSSSSTSRTFVATLRKERTLSFTLNYDSADTTHAALATAANAGTEKNFTLVLADTGAEAYAFAANITDFTTEAPVEGVNTKSVTLQITGDITIS